MASEVPELRPTTTFPAAERHRELIGAKLHCLVKAAQVCEQFVQGRYVAVSSPGIEHAITLSRPSPTP